MSELYGSTLKEVLPRSEALVNGVLRFGPSAAGKGLSKKSNPGPREDRTGIANAASSGVFRKREGQVERALPLLSSG